MTCSIHHAKWLETDKTKGIKTYYCFYAVSRGINSHVLMGENPCFNKEIHVLL